jgi:class 3 adenylate cyclase
MDPLTSAIVIAALIAVGPAAYLIGRRSSQRPNGQTLASGRRLEEYPFYPFIVNAQGHVEFSAEAFDEAVGYLLTKRNERAARELIVIGEQNLIRDTFPSDRLRSYKRLYEEYDGDGVVSDNDAFLENYRRLVNQLGRSFPHTGIEVLLHNLVNPSKSLVAIENGEVTGRSVGSGATNLVLDLKTRRQAGEDKVNYELNIGSRQFKCTTVPIFRPEYGLVGAVCVNVDTRFIRDALAPESERIEAFVDNLLRTDFELDENILSKDEYQNALRGKRHYLDEAIRSPGGRSSERKLTTVLFTDLAHSTEEAARLGDDRWRELLQQHRDIARTELARWHGQEIDTAGDGFLMAFDGPENGVRCALAIAEATEPLGLSVRCGLHSGEVEFTGDGITGLAVHIGARIAGTASPGEVRVSRTVKDLVAGGELDFIDSGYHTLKGVPEEWQLFTVKSS